VDQTNEAVDPSRNAMQHVSNGAEFVEVNGAQVHVPSYLEQFLFDREALYTPMGRLSGGEQDRIDLAKKLLRGGNVLVLDEPTNNLDLATLRVVEEVVESFPGCALMVSHDRYFLNRLCTHVLAFAPEGRILQISGNYDDYAAYLAAEEEAQTERSPRPSTTARTRVRSQPRLTWQQQRQLEKIEARIPQLEHEAARLESQIAAPEFYRQNHDDVRDILSALDAAKAQLADLYSRWAELEDLRGA